MVAVKELFSIDIHKHLQKQGAPSYLCCQGLGSGEVLGRNISHGHKDDDNLLLALKSCEEES